MASYVPPSLVASVATSQMDQLFINADQDSRKSNKFWSRVVNILASVTFVMAWIALWAEDFSTICVIAFSIPLFVSPYAIWQRRKLRKLPTLRQVINHCRWNVNRLMVQNQRYAHENDRLSQENQRLSGVQQELQVVAQQQGCSAEELRRKIHEYGEIQREMEVGLNVEIDQCDSLLHSLTHSL